MISIVIPLYNKEKQIQNTLNSVLKQIFQDFEIIVVDDGSSDKSAEIVKTIQDPRIRLISQQNQGVSVARNTGIEEAKYDYIALLDADDEWKSTYLKTQINLIRYFPECSVYACSYEFNRDRKISPIILNKIPFKEESGILSNYFEVASYSHPPIWSSSVIVKKSAFLSIGGFPVGIKSGEDLLTWAKLAVDYKIAYSRKVEACFVIPEDISHRNDRLNLDEKNKIHLELQKLQQKLNKENKTYKDLGKYIGRWNEMTASSLLRNGNGNKALKYSLKALKYKGVGLKLMFFVFLSFTPAFFQKIIMNK